MLLCISGYRCRYYFGPHNVFNAQQQQPWIATWAVYFNNIFNFDSLPRSFHCFGMKMSRVIIGEHHEHSHYMNFTFLLALVWHFLMLGKIFGRSLQFASVVVFQVRRVVFCRRQWQWRHSHCCLRSRPCASMLVMVLPRLPLLPLLPKFCAKAVPLCIQALF